jgi:hypothetical protein
VVAPHPVVTPSPSTPAVVAPPRGDAGKAANSHATKAPSRWSNATPLSGVSATWSGPSGQGRLVTDDKGILALGALSPGTYSLAFDTSGIAPNHPSPRLLVGLLQPAVQKVRTVSKPLTPGLKGRLKIEVGPNGDAKTIRSVRDDGGGESDSEVGDAAAIAFGGRGIRLMFALSPNANPNSGR